MNVWLNEVALEKGSGIVEQGGGDMDAWSLTTFSKKKGANSFPWSVGDSWSRRRSSRVSGQ